MRNLITLILLTITTTLFGSSLADYTSDKQAGCPPLLVNFKDNSTFQPTTWAWDFGNGNTSSLQNPSATFLNSGTYQVKLVVSDGVQTDSVTKTIRVFKLPAVDFIADRPTACSVDTVTFTSKITLGDAGISDYAWGFGNGIAQSNANTSYIYGHPGSYDVTLVVQDSNGCSANKTAVNFIRVFPAPTAAFTASPTHSCNLSQVVKFTNQSVGGGLKYTWYLDNGVTTATTNPVYTYTNEKVTVKLVAVDTNGCAAFASANISVGPLVADFNPSKTKACTGEPIQFSNTSSFSGTSWFWDFGDGSTSNASSPTHIYANPGTYTVSMVIHDGACTDSITKPYIINIRKGFAVSTPALTASQTITCAPPLTVHFNTTTPGGQSYLWDFGNGDTASAKSPTYTFNGSGNFSITLTIFDSSGCSITGTVTNMIQTAKPVAKFVCDSSMCSGGIVHFTNQSTNAQSYIWNFGDGNVSTLKTPTHSYSTWGPYNVSLTAINNAGCDSTTTKSGAVHIDTLQINFKVNSTFSPCPPFACTMRNLSAPGLKYVWIFGDGYTDTAANPTHIYFYPGVYTVSLVGYTAQGCRDTITYRNLITVQGPTGQFTLAPKTGCVPLNVSFSATPSSNTKSIVCDFGDGNILPDSTKFTHIYNDAKVFHPQFILTDYVGCSVSYPLDSVVTLSSPNIQGHDTLVCPGSIVTLASDPGTYTYKWVSTGGNINCDTCSSIKVTAQDNQAYILTVNNQNGCPGQATYHVNTESFPVLDSVAEIHLCKGDTATLFAGNAAKVIWSPATYLNNDSIANPLCSPLASTTYTVTAYSRLGCATSENISVVIKEKTDITVPQQIDACSDGTVQLNTTLNYGSDLGVHYMWSPALHLDNPTISDPVATIGKHDITYQVIASSGHCIPDTQSVTVHVHAKPDLEVSQSVVTTANAEVQLYAASHQQLTYHWYSNNDSFSCESCRHTNFYPTQSQVIYVEGTTALGCTVKDSVMVEIKGCDPNGIFMPNTFTPNGDGLNDKFRIRTNVLSSIKYFRIFDEWGNLVFETHNLDEAWDGSTNGKANQMGVYVYVLEGQCSNGSDVLKTGNVTALR